MDIGQTTSRSAVIGRGSLWTACAIGGLAQSLAGTAGTLLADTLGGSAAWAGLPQALQVGGTAVASVGLSRLTERIGRRPALVLGAAVAVAGCGLAVLGAAVSSLAAVLVASALVGAGNSAVLLGRYAAADLAPETDRARAMGLALTIITVGAVAGPNLMPLAAGLTPAGPEYGGSYVVAGIAFALAGIVLSRGSSGGAPRTEHADPVPAGPHRPGRSPAMWPGLVVLAVANLVMISVMTVAPVQLHQHGTGLGMVGAVVSVHIAAMFAPSSASAWAVGRFGVRSVVVTGAAVLVVASVVAALWPSSPTPMFAAMAALGLGWNLCLVSGSTLVTAGVSPAVRPRREGWGEFVMGVAASAGGAGAGLVMAGAGYSAVAVVGAVAALVPALAAASRAARWAARRAEDEVIDALDTMPVHVPE